MVHDFGFITKEVITISHLPWQILRSLLFGIIYSDMDERMSWLKSNDTGVVGLTRDSR